MQIRLLGGRWKCILAIYYFVSSNSVVNRLIYLLFFLEVLDFGYILSTGNLHHCFAKAGLTSTLKDANLILMEFGGEEKSVRYTDVGLKNKTCWDSVNILTLGHHMMNVSSGYSLLYLFRLKIFSQSKQSGIPKRSWRLRSMKL